MYLIKLMHFSVTWLRKRTKALFVVSESIAKLISGEVYREVAKAMRCSWTRVIREYGSIGELFIDVVKYILEGGLRCTHMNPMIYGYYSGLPCWRSKILEKKARLNKNNMIWYIDFLNLRIIASKSIMFKGIHNKDTRLKFWC